MIIEKNYFIDSEFLPLGHSPVISGSSDKWGGGGGGEQGRHPHLSSLAS